MNGQAEFSIDYLQPKIWLDADDNYTILSKNEKVSEWLDKSGSSYHLSQSNEAQKPFTNSGKINGKNVIFNRKDQHKLGRVTPENANWQDLFIVSQWTGTEDKFPGWAGLVTASSLSGDGLGVGILGHHQQKHIFKNTANGWFDHFYLNGIYSEQWNVFEEMKQPFLASISSDSSISVKGLIVGVDRNYNTRGWEGYIGEIIAFDYKLSDYERSRVSNYLSYKWNLPNSSEQNNILPFESPFRVDENGSLSANKIFDYETDDINHSISLQAVDDAGNLLKRDIYILIENVIEDYDSDGIEDFYDNDLDGDGVSNSDEISFKSDPWDKNSFNLPPSHISQTAEFSLTENSVNGTEVGVIDAKDLETNHDISFSIVPQFPNKIHPLVWLDTEDNSTLIDEKSAILTWFDRSKNGNDFIQNNESTSPSFGHRKHADHKVVNFNGNSFLYADDLIYVGESFSIFLVAGIDETDDAVDSLFSAYTSCTTRTFQFDARTPGRFEGMLLSNSEIAKDIKFMPQSEMGPAIYELVFNFNSQKLECFLNGNSLGTASYHTLPDPNLVFRLFTNRSASAYPSGFVGEFIILPFAADQEQRKLIEGYLGSKWQITTNDPIFDPLYSISETGKIFLRNKLDFETDQNHSLIVRVTDSKGAYSDRTYSIQTLNVVEDRDNDGIEDHYDPDDDNDGIPDTIDTDNDNDGFSDSYEIAYGSDPYNANSVANKFPTALYLNGSNIVENSPLNTIVGKLVTEDPDLSDTFSYTLISGEGSNSNALFTLSTDGILNTAYVFDHEDRKDHSIRVRVEDQFGASLENSFSLTIDNLYLPVAVTHPHTEGANEVLFKGEILENGGEAPESFGIQLSSNITFENAETLLSSKITGKFFSITKRELALARTYYYRAFAINSEGTAYGAIMRFHQPGPDWWLDLSPETTNGWIIDSWMGSMHPYPNQWAYHRRLGWIFMNPDGSDGYWIWREENGWLWTNSYTWPFLWAHGNPIGSTCWPENNKALFYDYGSGSVR